MIIPERIKKQLRKPLGRVHKDLSFLKKSRKRIISIGDESTANILSLGIRPHLAVFDFKIMRKKVSKGMRELFLSSFGKIKRYKNRKGTLSEKLLRDAPRLLRDGGGVLIDGEEDLTALAFMLKGGKKDLIVYGQPRKGIVAVEPKKIKVKIKKILSSFLAT